ncbi:MAG: bifunctional (p)ppGpp synthetase/guanosine-3',5'-bis(diphosphate) 3'-pyrophosphohydrolase [Clostridia bacterium]|nr:bifunctional (p)ppGpp synthetase/guanosine-3',5'-bis(diphosphate) 3'-pyrophosphohydrolase [Clostridia bacterium]
MKERILEKIFTSFALTDKEKKIVNECFVDDINIPRLETVLDTMSEYRMQGEIVVPYILFQAYKSNPDKANELVGQYLTDTQKKLYDTFIVLKDVRALSRSGEAESIRKMFVAICQDIRIVIVKFATILFDLKLIKNPMSEDDREYVQIVSDIFAPLAERLGLSMFKFAFEDICFELLEPQAYEELKNSVLLKQDDNQKQIEITSEKLKQILQEIGVKGELQSRQKHYSSIYKKLIKKDIKLEGIYDLIAMRVLVPSVEDCYAVLGKIHAIYRPIQGRVKDYIANPKPNGYQSLHTTIVAENNRPLEIQIRTFEMHKFSEYGVAAHWIYKERRGQNKFDQKMSWFRQILENAQELSSEEFLETLKVDLYGESIFVQTPKGKVLEFPLGATIIDFAYAIHSGVGNTCVGAKINGKIVPITSTISNGDVVEILTNPNSKGPSRDWLAHIKTSSARSKIRAFFKSELKDENIRIGKSILEQAVKSKNLNITKILKEEYLFDIANSMMMESLDSLYAEIGAGSLSANSIVGRLVNRYNKDKTFDFKENIITVKKNKDGVLVDGDSGLLIRYAGCCSPITGDEIVGYISRGRGVTIHRADCPNLKYLEPERLIKAEWQENVASSFVAVIKIHADNENSVITTLNNIARDLKNKLKGFGYKEIKNELVFDIVVLISNKSELQSIINSFESVKKVRRVYRSE